MTLQEIRAQLGDSQSSVQRLEAEHKRLTKALSSSRDAGEQHKNEAERLLTTIQEMKNKHETDIAQARKHAAGLLRDKSDLQQTIDTLKAEAARAARRLPRYGSPMNASAPDEQGFLTPAGQEDRDDVFGTTGRASTNRRNLDVSALFPPEDLGDDFGDTPDPSPIKRPFLAPNHPANEIEALQQRLAHAQRQINTLKGTLNREKQTRMRLEAAANAAASEAPADREDEPSEEFQEEDTAIENKRGSKRSITPFKVGGGRSTRGRGRGRGGRGGITLIQRLGMAASSPSSDYYDDEDHPRRSMEDSPPPPVPSIRSQHHVDEDDEVSQFFGSGHGHEEADESESAPGRLSLSRSRSPSPTPSSPQEPPSNRTSVDGMDPAFANVLRRIPSNGSSYTRSPLRQAVLGRSARGGTVGRRQRGGVAYKEPRPASIVDAPEVLAAELGDVNSSSSQGANTSLLNAAEILEEEDDGDEYIRVKKVEKVDFACQTELAEEEKTIILSEPPILAPIPVPPPSPKRMEMGVQSEPEPVLPPKVETAEFSLQTDPEPVAKKAEIGTQHSAPEPVLPAPSVMVDSSIGTDPIPELTTIGKGLPPLLIGGDTSRRTTVTQSNISQSESSSGDTTITRSFLAAGPSVEDEDEYDEGEETETGADTDYHDARQSIVMSTPTEDFHSVRTMTENDYSDSEDVDDAESIKASQLTNMHNQSTSSFNRPHTASSYYPPVSLPAVSYESVGVSADLYVPPSPVILEAPKPEVKEISVQTDEWKPPAPVLPPAVAPSPKPIGLYRVGSTSHQFQFIPPPSPQLSSSTSSNVLSASANAPVFTAPSPVPTPMSSIFRESSNGGISRRTTTSDRRQSIESLVSSGTGHDDLPNRSRVPSGNTILASVDKSRPPVMSLPPPPKLPPPPNNMPPPNFIPERKILANLNNDQPPPRPSSPPPPELIQRATTPLGSILSVSGGRYGPRHPGTSLPPSQANLRQPPSTSSFRSGGHPSTYGHASLPPSKALSSYSVRENERKERSTTSLPSDHSSHRSSMSSDRHIYRPVNEPTTPNKTADTTPRANGMLSTDPTIIHAITQTMIGEFLYKYTRKTIGRGVGEKRHKRFFWVHPYTKTLYWSSADPGSSNVSESSAKSGMLYVSPLLWHMY